MEVASVGRTAGLAREVLERARRRRRRAAGPEEDSERLSAAFDSIMKLMSQASKECEKYYSFVAAPGCKEHEMKHICKYHGRQAGERGQESMEEERNEPSEAPSRLQTCQQHTRRGSKDFYIEVSPGIYSVTAISEDMVQQTQVVDVNAGQSVDLTFVL
ncbi:A-kinase-interacting protein 1 isoform X1 [Pithys albifrons albifrons]|uniref:A-kinase-interacting protein 1 isoform X1 n=1 Tax=Pithys albifrons albifrons TaxID=3385563 RepID=UPI003A5D0A5F